MNIINNLEKEIPYHTSISFSNNINSNNNNNNSSSSRSSTPLINIQQQFNNTSPLSSLSSRSTASSSLSTSTTSSSSTSSSTSSSSSTSKLSTSSESLNSSTSINLFDSTIITDRRGESSKCNLCYRLQNQQKKYCPIMALITTQTTMLTKFRNVRNSSSSILCTCTSKPTAKYLLPLIIICIIILIYWLSHGYMISIFFWIERQNLWITFFVFIGLFTIVSFPIVVGYLILIISSGYLFGIWRGIITVVLGANIGAAIAQFTIRNFQKKLPIQRILKHDTGKAILRVISGPSSFKVVLLARLTPIPFGLQNTIFGVSNVHPKSYYIGTLIGLFPAQLINVVIGSSLRSMRDVLHNHNTAMTSYIMFAVQICIGLILMTWVVHKARKELSSALLLDIDDDFNVIVEVA